jgi:hopanoid-associated phosphorylase
LPGVGVITGTRREAGCLRRAALSAEFSVLCSGASASRAAEHGRTLLKARCSAILSFGVAGGLDPALSPGTVVIAASVIAPDGSEIATSGPWRAALEADLDAAGIKYVSGAIVGVEAPIDHPDPKRTIHAATGALCVDMESHVAMLSALRAGLPGLAVRAIADTAMDALPDVALSAIGSRGEVRIGAMIDALLRQPGDLPDLLRLARVSRPAFASLRRVAAVPGLFGGAL